MIQQADVESILKQGRDFYKFGRKSTTKFYMLPLLTKHFTRNRSTTAEAKAELHAQRQSLYRGDPVHYGQQLWENGLTLGNCGEMVSLVAWLVKTARELASKVTMNVVAGNLDSPSSGSPDHAFNIVIDRTGTWPPQFSRIDQIERVVGSTAGMWVIDLWANLACPIAEYPGLLRGKAQTWSTQGKWIEHPNGKSPAKYFVDLIARQTLSYIYV